MKYCNTVWIHKYVCIYLGFYKTYFRNPSKASCFVRWFAYKYPVRLAIIFDAKRLLNDYESQNWKPIQIHFISGIINYNFDHLGNPMLIPSANRMDSKDFAVLGAVEISTLWLQLSRSLHHVTLAAMELFANQFNSFIQAFIIDWFIHSQLG